jgi:hypothetical protein
LGRGDGIFETSEREVRMTLRKRSEAQVRPNAEDLLRLGEVAQVLISKDPTPPMEEFANPQKEGPIGRLIENLEESEGEEVSVTWGAEKYSPVQYQVCEVGPLFGKTVIRKGETRKRAAMRLHQELAEIGAELRRSKVEEFLEGLKHVSAEVRRRAER